MTTKDTQELNSPPLVIGGRYNWKYQRERLIYLGKKKGVWNQFALVGVPTQVWCEVLDADLQMIEVTK